MTRDSIEDKKWKIITALAFFDSLNASEIKRLLNPITKTHTNEKIRTTDFSNNRTIDKALKELNSAEEGILSYDWVERKGIESAEDGKIKYRDEENTVRRYILHLDKAIKKIINEKCDYPNKTKEIIKNAILKLWEDNNWGGLNSTTMRDEAWTKNHYKVRFNDIILSIVTDMVLLRIQTELAGKEAIVGYHPMPNWKKITDEEVFYLSAFRAEIKQDRLFGLILLILNKASKRIYAKDWKGNPIVTTKNKLKKRGLKNA
ncbi:MAG: hypothetical protein ABIE23_05450 [archaeon]